jgi:hypothetical protein
MAPPPTLFNAMANSCTRAARPFARAAAARDAGEQLDPPCPAAAAVMAHSFDDLPERQIAMRGVDRVQHAVLAAPVAGDAQIPAREGSERLVEGFPAGRQRVVAVAAPVALGRRSDCHRLPASGDGSVPVRRTMRAKNAWMREPVSRPNMRHVQQGRSSANLLLPSTRASSLPQSQTTESIPST